MDAHNDNNSNRIEEGRYTIVDNVTGEEIHLRRINPTYGKPAIVPKVLEVPKVSKVIVRLQLTLVTLAHFSSL